MPLIFINYRVDEQAAYAALLDRALSDRFGEQAVFLAARSLRAGDDFQSEVFGNLRRSSVILAVIGAGWADSADRHGNRRLEAADDWVLRELTEAFALGIRVVPILIEETPLPAADELPPMLQPLAGCQYLRLHHYSTGNDLKRITEELDRILNPWRSTVLPRSGRRPGRIAQPGPHQESTETTTRYFRLTGDPEPRCRLGVVPGGILRARGIDVWVNSENTAMEMARTSEFSISGIIRYWGAHRDRAGRVVADVVADELASAVAGLPPVSPGTVVVTGAGSLTGSHGVRHIVHVAAVSGEPGAGFRQVRDIGLCIDNVLAAAESLAAGDPAVRTILLPLLGAGSGGGGVATTARGTVRAVVHHMRSHQRSRLAAINLLAFTADEFTAVLQAVHRSGELRADTTADGQVPTRPGPPGVAT